MGKMFLNEPFEINLPVLENDPKSNLNTVVENDSFNRMVKIKRENSTITEIKNDEENSEISIQQTPTIEAKIIEKEIKHLLKEIMLTPLAQAIINIIFTPHLAIRTFLLIFVLFSSGFASYLVIKSIMDYFAYEVTTTSRIIYETPTLFPKVTFCNTNYFTTEYASNLNDMNSGAAANIIYTLSDVDKKRLGHDLKDILIACSFNLEQCNSSDFVWSFDDMYGNCYTFNSGFDSNGNTVDLKKTTLSDPNFGLQLILYVNFYEKLGDNFGGLDGDQMTSGAIIRIGNSSYSSYYSNGGILASSGFQTNIAVSREFHSNLPEPYSTCEIDSNSPRTRSDSEFYNLVGQSNYAYTQQVCIIQCLQNFCIKNFNCTFPFAPSFYNVSTCDWDFAQISSNFEHKISAIYKNEICLPMCPLECNQTLYKTSISNTRLIANKYFTNAIRNNPILTADFINRTIDETSFVIVKIFYDSLSYVESTESPKLDSVALLGSIGGNLGMFLGVSVFTLCEIIEATLETVYSLKKSKKITHEI